MMVGMVYTRRERMQRFHQMIIVDCEDTRERASNGYGLRETT